MGVARFEDLRVWQLAKTLCDEIGTVIRRPRMSADAELTRQLNAAVLSTVANIAEGFMREGHRDFARFVRIAAASNGEARAMLHAARGRCYLTEHDAERLKDMTNQIGRMLRALERSLRAH